MKYSGTPAAFAAAMTSSSRTEPPGSTTARTPGVEQHLQPVGEREERVRRRHRAGRPVARPGDREPRRVDPVDLAHADADGRAAGGQQDRVGLHRPDRPPGEREVGQHLRRRPARRRQRPRRRVVAGRVDGVGRLQQQAAADLPELDAAAGLPSGATSTRIDGLRDSTSTAPSS